MTGVKCASSLGVPTNKYSRQNSELVVGDEMKIIRIPQKSPETAPDPNHKLHVGPVGFTCPSCKSYGEISFSKIVFRSLDFYCSGCGSYYKMTNPAFGQTPKR